MYGRDDAAWALVQVDLNETDPIAARDFAIYQVRWYTPSIEDGKHKPVAEC